MTKYYVLTDKSHRIYAAATFLNPTKRRDFFDNAWVGKLQPWVEVMLANCRDIWEQDYAHLAPRKKKKKKKKKRDAFEEWPYRKEEEDIGTDEFRRYSRAGSAVPATERFDSIARWSRPDIEEAFPTLQR